MGWPESPGQLWPPEHLPAGLALSPRGSLSSGKERCHWPLTQHGLARSSDLGLPRPWRTSSGERMPRALTYTLLPPSLSYTCTPCLHSTPCSLTHTLCFLLLCLTHTHPAYTHCTPCFLSLSHTHTHTHTSCFLPLSFTHAHPAYTDTHTPCFLPLCLTHTHPAYTHSTHCSLSVTPLHPPHTLLPPSQVLIRLGLLQLSTLANLQATNCQRWGPERRRQRLEGRGNLVAEQHLGHSRLFPGLSRVKSGCAPRPPPSLCHTLGKGPSQLAQSRPSSKGGG